MIQVHYLTLFYYMAFLELAKEKAPRCAEAEQEVCENGRFGLPY